MARGQQITHSGPNRTARQKRRNEARQRGAEGERHPARRWTEGPCSAEAAFTQQITLITNTRNIRRLRVLNL